MIYVPNLANYQCVVINNNQTIRAYTSTPNYNSTSNYDDYYYNSHYLKQNGSQTWNNYSTLPVCLSSSELTDNVFYRNDITDILFTFVLLVLIIGFPLWLIIKRFFKGKRRF